MKDKPKNPAAFPMSLRDYFAGQALLRLAAPICDAVHVDSIASDCYTWADAMLKAREANND
jgi:hypothetical protein